MGKDKDLEEKDLEKDKDLEYLLKYLELLKRIVLLLSPIVLLFGFSEFLIYSIFIAKDPSFIVNFSYSFKIISFYYATLTLFLIIFIVFLLAFPLLFQVIENRLPQILKKWLFIIIAFFILSIIIAFFIYRLPQILKKWLFIIIAFFILSIIIAFFIYRLPQILKRLFFLFIYIPILLAIICIIFCYIFYIYIKQGGFFILPIIGYNLPIWISLLYYLGFMVLLCLLMKDITKTEGKDRIKAILSLFIIIAVTYTKFLIIKPLKLSKLGYFEAILTLEKEYINQPGFQACLKKCQTEGEREEEQQNTSTYNSNQPQDIQNNNYQKLFFVFLRTSSEYIVGCSKHSNVRIYIPSDKVIAIKYVENQKTRGQKIQPNNDKK